MTFLADSRVRKGAFPLGTRPRVDPTVPHASRGWASDPRDLRSAAAGAARRPDYFLRFRFRSETSFFSLATSRCLSALARAAISFSFF